MAVEINLFEWQNDYLTMVDSAFIKTQVSIRFKFNIWSRSTESIPLQKSLIISKSKIFFRKTWNLKSVGEFIFLAEIPVGWVIFVFCIVESRLSDRS